MSYASTCSFHACHGLEPTLVSDFVELCVPPPPLLLCIPSSLLTLYPLRSRHAQLFAVVKAFTPWLVQYYLKSLRSEATFDDVKNLLNSSLETVILLFAKQVVREFIFKLAFES